MEDKIDTKILLRQQLQSGLINCPLGDTLINKLLVLSLMVNIWAIVEDLGLVKST